MPRIRAAEPRTTQEIALQWQRLAERRREHLLELYRSGRWRRYYTEDQIMSLMRDTVRNIEEWGEISGEQPARAAADFRALREAAE